MAEEQKDELYFKICDFLRGQKVTPGKLDGSIKRLLDTFLYTNGEKISDEEYNNIANEIKNRYEINIGINHPDSKMIYLDDSDNWFDNLHSDFLFFNRYKSFLTREGFSNNTICSIEKSTKEVIRKCANPNNLKGSKKRGLVVGDVQSGKTSNYLGLINMACDAGYKIILLLAGMTDKLRKQTQGRIDEGFLGVKSETINNDCEYIGVGIEERKYYGIPLTNIEKDFLKYSKESNNANSKDYNKPIILVVKKNKSILEGVASWLKPEENDKNNNILIVDDEADNASINTKKNDVTAINKAIRIIFDQFNVATYVGYTATPFANIFINPEDEYDENQDLFPADFIQLLDTPSTYFGFDKTFDKSDNEYKHISIINTDDPNYFPSNHKKNDEFSGITNDLEEAIINFYICNVIRTLRGDSKKHRSMMINISRFNNIQEQIFDEVEEYNSNFLNELQELNFKDDISFFKSKKLKKLYDIFTNKINYRNSGITWDDLRANLLNEVKNVFVRIINNKNDFNYDDYEETGARVIAIGGFILSRGLTLKGLIISYFNRNSLSYDTLLQMCRWFGYRDNYEDLCQIYMTSDNIDYFEEVNDAVEDLKIQFEHLKQQNKRPIDFGLMVKESPSDIDNKLSLLVTARNKMRYTKVINTTLNYSGYAIDTSKIYKDERINNNNLKAIQDLIKELFFDGKKFSMVENRIFVNDVSKTIIISFLNKIKIPFENTKFNIEGIVEYLNSESNEFKSYDIVIPSGISKKSFTISDLSVNYSQRYYDINKVKNEDFYRISANKNRLLDPNSFSSGLSQRQMDEVTRKIEIEYQNGLRKKKNPTTRDYLEVKGRNPLLVIYPVELIAKEKGSIDIIDNNKIVYGFALGFPGIDNGVRLKYRANITKIKELKKRYDEEDIEDD